MRFLSAPMETVNGPGPEKWPHTKHTDTCTTKRPTETRHALLKESKKWVTSILSDLGTLRHIWWPGRLFPAPYRLHCVPMIARWLSYHRHTPSPTTNKRTCIVPQELLHPLACQTTNEAYFYATNNLQIVHRNVGKCMFYSCFRVSCHLYIEWNIVHR